MTAFRPAPGLRAVISGIGSVREALAGELAAQGVDRPMVVCGANLAKSPLLEVVVSSIGGEPAVYDGCRPHVPTETVDEGLRSAVEAGADGLIALGGSSAIDCAKGIATLLAIERSSLAELEPLDFGRLGDLHGGVGHEVPVVTVTTTLSFAEFFGFWGARHADLGRKLPYGDEGLVPRTVFLDGEMAADTPDDVWVETGIKALDDAISTFCRTSDPEPFGDPVLTEGIRMLTELLPGSVGRERAEIRQQVLTATWMTKHSLPRLARPVVPAWFSTAARHSLGGVYGLPHGIGSCVSLPVGLEFHAGTTRPRQQMLAGALGWPQAPEGGAPLGSGLDALLARLDVPTRLRAVDAALDLDRLDDVARAMLAESPRLGSFEEIRTACERMR